MSLILFSNKEYENLINQIPNFQDENEKTFEKWNIKLFIYYFF